MLALALAAVLTVDDAPLLPRGHALLVTEHDELALQIAALQDQQLSYRPCWIFIASGALTAAFGAFFAFIAAENESALPPPRGQVRDSTYGVGIAVGGLFGAVVGACWGIWARLANSDSAEQLDALRDRFDRVHRALIEQSWAREANGSVPPVRYVPRDDPQRP